MSPRECVQAVGLAFCEHGMQQVGVMPREILWADPDDAEPRSRALKLSAAYMRESKVMGGSIYAVHFTPGSVDMWLTIFDGVTGQMLGIINGKILSVWKTAATAAVAARALARANSRNMALIGTGSYAFAQLAFLKSVMDIAQVRCFSRNSERLAAFCAMASRSLGIDVAPAASAAVAVQDADIVTTITTSPRPVLLGQWLPAGVHCNIMGQHAPAAREVDTAAVTGARVFVDSMAQAMNEKGEILMPISEGAMSDDRIAGELGSVLAGTCVGRTGDAERTMFCSGGTAFEYMSLCALLLERAKAAEIGTTLT